MKDENEQSTECDSNGLVEKLAEKLLDSEDEIEILDGQTREWIDALEALSKIEVAFGTKELHAKTILDVGTVIDQEYLAGIKTRLNTASTEDYVGLPLYTRRLLEEDVPRLIQVAQDTLSN